VPRIFCSIGPGSARGLFERTQTSIHRRRAAGNHGGRPVSRALEHEEGLPPAQQARALRSVIALQV